MVGILSMSEHNYLSPPEIAEATIQNGIKKTELPVVKMIVLGILAGAFIAFAAEGSNMASYNLLSNIETYGLGKALSGAIFSTGLMLVLIAGGELFTGNATIIISVLDKKVSIKNMLKNWFFVYCGNFIGAVFVAYMMVKSGLFNSGANELGGMTIKIASSKVGLTFAQGFYLGIMCNWLVCLAVWMATGAKDITGKILSVFFTIWLFVTSGFEHSIANMYYIPAGILAKGNENWVGAALNLGVKMKGLNSLNWKNFIIKNLIPVTFGNIIGGVLFVGMAYWYVYIRNKNLSHEKSKQKSS
jgi:formate/nitrite transporter